jgi:capsid protein
MVNEQVMIDTVKRMLEAGIDEPTIITTLTEAGLGQDEALAIIQRVKSPTPLVQQTPQQGTDVQAMRTELQTQAEAQELNQTAIHNKLDLHEDKIDQVLGAVGQVKEAVASVNPPMDTTLSMRISALEQKVAEVNAAATAQLDLLEKILETNRKILTELEAQK